MMNHEKMNSTNEKSADKVDGFLVEAAGIEPASKNQFIQLSPGADDY